MFGHEAVRMAATYGHEPSSARRVEKPAAFKISKKMEAHAHAQTPDSRATDSTNSGLGEANRPDRNLGVPSMLCAHELPPLHGCITQQLCSGGQCTSVIAPLRTTHTQQGLESTQNSRRQNPGTRGPGRMAQSAMRTRKITVTLNVKPQHADINHVINTQSHARILGISTT